MQELLKKMDSEERERYKSFISDFTAAMRVFSGVQETPKDFYDEIEKKVEQYILFMKSFGVEKQVQTILGNQAIKFFVIQEVHNVYSQR